MQLATGTSLGFKFARDCDVVQPPPQLPRQSVPRSGSRLRRDGVQLVGVFRERRHIGARHMANPGTTNATVGGGAFASVRQQYGMTAYCSPIQRDVKPVGADSLIGSIPIAHHRNAGTYDWRALASPPRFLPAHEQAMLAWLALGERWCVGQRH
jgi:hypothetical protein